MVPIEFRSPYLLSIEDNDLLMIFEKFLNLKIWPGPFRNELNEMDQICFDIVKAIINESPADFDSTYRIISKKLPNKNSNAPFVHNDYLIFTLITGIVKFNLDKAWIKQILEVRANNDTTKTLRNLIEGDYSSKQNLFSIVICFFNLTDPNKSNKDVLDIAYIQISDDLTLFQNNNDFIKLCSIAAYNSVILSRTPIDTGDYDALKKIETVFFKRTKILSYVIYNAFLIGLFLAIYKMLIRYPEAREKANDLGLIIGILGVGIGNYITSARVGLENLLVKFFGYKPKKDNSR